ncbi:thioredoxin [Lacticaseibacillus sp. GG6-2]
MTVKPINDRNFAQETDSGLVVIDFNATWCPPCKMMNPIVEKLSDEMSGQIAFKSLDVDQNQQTAAQMQVQGIPTFIIKKDGQIIDRLVGFQPEPVFTARLRKYLD